MDSFLRFFIKFYGYTIGVWCILVSLFLSTMIVLHMDFMLPLEQFYDFRFMGSSALFFGLAWLGVGVSMIYGTIKENAKFLYPMPILYMLELFMLFTRDVVMIWRNEPTYKMAFVDPVGIACILYVTLHVLMSIVALAKLFQQTSKSKMEFSRLEVNQAEDNDTQEIN